MLRRRALLPLAALALWACSERVEPAGGGATAATTAASREGLLHVGTARCVSCHAEEAASWAGSHHDLALILGGLRLLHLWAVPCHPCLCLFL